MPASEVDRRGHEAALLPRNGAAESFVCCIPLLGGAELWPAKIVPENTIMGDTPTLGQVNLVVRDLRASVTFYRRLGLTVQESGRPEWVPHHATAVMPNGIRLEMDSAAFAKQWNPGWKGHSSGASCVLFFGVNLPDEVDRLFEAMAAAGCVVEKTPEDAFWGARYAIIEDPDGNPVGIMSPVDPARRRAPPPPP